MSHRGLGGSGAAADGGAPLSVSALTRRIRATLEDRFGRVEVEGEIGSLTRARSGHLYLTLKDDHAVLDTVLWRSSAARLGFSPAEGDRVVARGEITVYEPRGRYQLVATSLRPVGAGELQKRFEALVLRLREEGLFEPEHKKPLPALPQTVGVVTSATGAAVRDIIRVLRRRMPGVRIVVSPCVVQGTGAAAEIVRALERIDRWGGCDVLIVGRGGGSLEDLWAFNEEAVARAIFAAHTPVVSAVGHEVDLTVADLVADRRAATPSEAAETVVPEAAALRRQLLRVHDALCRRLRGRMREGRQRLALALQFLRRGARGSLREKRSAYKHLARAAAFRKAPRQIVRLRQQRLDEASMSLARAARSTLEAKRRRLALVSARLEGLSPLAVLGRGYSLTRLLPGGEVVRDASRVAVGSRLETRLAAGRILSDVVATEE